MTFKDRYDFDAKFEQEWPEDRLAEYYVSMRAEGNMFKVKGAD